MTKVIYKNHTEIDKAVSIIDKFKKVNKINFRLDIHLDYEIEDCGHYLENQKEVIVNPSLIDQPFFSFGFPLTIQTNMTTLIIHEFGHYLDGKYNIEKKYDKYCLENGKLLITPYTFETDDIVEELGEIIQIYLLNPFILKTIDNKRYNFIKKFFKSPTPCTEKTFIDMWVTWNDYTKNECCHSYGISYDKNILFVSEPLLYNERTLSKVETECKKRVNNK